MEDIAQIGLERRLLGFPFRFVPPILDDPDNMTLPLPFLTDEEFGGVHSNPERVLPGADE